MLVRFANSKSVAKTVQPLALSHNVCAPKPQQRPLRRSSPRFPAHSPCPQPDSRHGTQASAASATQAHDEKVVMSNLLRDTKQAAHQIFARPKVPSGLMASGFPPLGRFAGPNFLQPFLRHPPYQCVLMVLEAVQPTTAQTAHALSGLLAHLR